MSAHCNELWVILPQNSDCPQNSWTYAVNQLFVCLDGGGLRIPIHTIFSGAVAGHKKCSFFWEL